ncbi:MAG: adenosine deaminase family protein [Acidimicrobiia bacterium]|nr:adenosine deaminase family protein [Acidimicrobiia bacterium]MDH5504646.1 adenosine deaminase family protein [Acidimicrobiia bacterium]
MTRPLPKVLLHDHLDGGLRIGTVLELATADLPTRSPKELTDWFDQEGVNSLDRYLDAFSLTVSAMQNTGNLERISYESAVDLAADGVVYAELRFAPSLATEDGLCIEDVLIAIDAGLDRAESETGICTAIIVDAMRQHSDSDDVVMAALRSDVKRVVGFDLAGPEAGFPPTLHRRACELALQGGLGLTIHAGEGDGVASIEAALRCGAQRIGHGVRIIEDCEVVGGAITDLGPVAIQVRDRQIALELCPTSNRHTLGIAIDEHPIDLLYRAGFLVTVSTDNRLMSRTSLTQEFVQLADTFGWVREDFLSVTENALGAAFTTAGIVDSILENQIRRGFAAPN